MIILLSPAKTLDFEKTASQQHSQPAFLKQAETLVSVLKKKKERDLQDLMGISEKLAQLNVARYQSFATPFSLDNSKQAILAFKGDVYIGLEAATFDEKDLNFAQDHVRILSGLYGMLRPLDLMQPYRLEMGTDLAFKKHKDLYDFWGDTITEQLNNELKNSGQKMILNLASNEYFKAINKKKLQGELLTINFKENRDGKLKFISFNAKKARGTMTNLIVKNRITKADDLKGLEVDGYVFSEANSKAGDWFFVKDV